MARAQKSIGHEPEPRQASPKGSNRSRIGQVAAEWKERLAQAGGTRSQQRRASARRLEAVFSEADQELQPDSSSSRGHRLGAK
jgi:hypothetical protein